MVARNLLVERNYQNFGGVNTTSAVTNLEISQASQINNGELTTTGSIKKRQGYIPLNGVAWNTNKIRLIKEYVRSGAENQMIAFGTDSAGTSGAIAQLSGAAYASGSSFSEILSVTSLKRPSMLQFEDIFFVFNGTEDKVWDGTDGYQIGITAPTVAPTGVAANGGKLNSGDYLFAYCYYNSSTGATSNIKLVAAAVTVVADQKITVTNTAGDSDTADKVRWFRTVVNGSQLFWEKDVDITSTGTDLGDAEEDRDSVIIVNTLAEYDNDRPPSSSIAHKIGNRIFMLDEDNKNNVYFTKVSNQHGSMPQSVPAENYSQCDPDDGDECVGINDANGIPLIFKERSFGRLVQTGESTYIYKKIADVECLSHHCIAKQGQNVVWLSRSNCHMSDGQSVIKTGDQVESTIKGLNFTSGSNFSGMLVNNKQQVLFSVCDDSVGTDGECDIVMVGDFKKQSMAWLLYEPKGDSYPAIQAASFGTRIGDSNIIEYLFGNAKGNGYAYKMDHGYTDYEDVNTGYGIYFEFITRWIDYGMDSSKLFKYINVKIDSTTGGESTVFVGIEYDLGTTINAVKDITLNRGQQIWANETSYTQLWGEEIWASGEKIDENCYLQRKAKQARVIFRNATSGIAIDLLGWGLYAGRMPFK